MTAATSDRVATLTELLAWREAHQADRPAFAFLGPDLEVRATDSYGSLARAARAVARALTAAGVARGPVVVAHPPGLDFVRSLWGALVAGAIAVPCYPPTDRRTAARLLAVVRDTEARAVLAPAQARGTFLRTTAEHSVARRIGWLAPAEAGAAAADRPDERGGGGAPAIAPEDPAIVQYTSGSVGRPRGVVLSHRNVLANSRRIYRAFFHTSKSRGLIWLPPYHDMGLIGGIIQPVFGGFRTCLMSPQTFLRSPLNWLRAITITGATTSGGPNFAYQACLGIDDQALAAAGLDLGCWQVAFNGAERVGHATLDAFCRKFFAHGFRPSRLMPCYGLAEATLYVSGASKIRLPTALSLERSALRRNRVRIVPRGSDDELRLVSNGMPGESVRIVDPAGPRRCGSGEIGEIWVAGDSVARGYWSGDEDSEATFGARLEPGGTAYLRTGDLGFLHAGELYVTGRLKELIVVRGQNHYAEDVEATVRSCHPGVAGLACAAFPVLDAGAGVAAERLVIVQEAPRRSLPEELREILESIRIAVFSEHRLAVSAVVFVKRGRIPRTPSGKVQRRACRDRYLAGELRGVFTWERPAGSRAVAAGAEDGRTAPPPEPFPDLGSLDDRRAAEVLRGWLMRVVGERIQVPVEQMDPDAHFGLYGLDSQTAAGLAATLSKQMPLENEEALFWDYPNFTLLAGHLVRQLRAEPVETRG